MVELPEKTIERCMKEDGADRISKEAKEEMSIFLRDVLFRATRASVDAAKLGKRKTIMAKDVKFAINNLI